MKDVVLYYYFAVVYAFKNRTLSHLLPMIKYYKRWYKDKHSGANTLTKALPWITYDAITYLRSICNPESIVFEWGSVGSTLFLPTNVNV